MTNQETKTGLNLTPEELEILIRGGFRLVQVVPGMYGGPNTLVPLDERPEYEVTGDSVFSATPKPPPGK